MLFQSLASVLVGLECLIRFTPDIYCDTMGAAFTYPAAYYLTGAKVIAYVHYPIISTVSGLSKIYTKYWMLCGTYVHELFNSLPNRTC